MNTIKVEQLDFKKSGELIPAVIQDIKTKAVLMLGYMNKEALHKTMTDERVTFWSRTKKRLWQKGECSGNVLEVVSITADCDNDSLLILVKPKGPTCHTGAYSCFGNTRTEGIEFLKELYDLIADRKKHLPAGSYTASLFKLGLSKILEKIAEESQEVIQASKRETTTRLIEESADLLYHLLVLLVQKKIALGDVIVELEQRNK